MAIQSVSHINTHIEKTTTNDINVKAMGLGDSWHNPNKQKTFMLE